MARRYETYTSQCGWAMEPCEERLFIAFYEDVRGNIDPSIKWPDKFEIGFYQEGFGVLDITGIRSTKFAFGSTCRSLRLERLTWVSMPGETREQ